MSDETFCLCFACLLSASCWGKLILWDDISFQDVALINWSVISIAVAFHEVTKAAVTVRWE